MFYYFLLLVAYAVIAVICAQPIWAFLGVTIDTSLAPMKVALIVFFVVSILIGIVSRSHYSYYLKDAYSQHKLKGKLIRRYLIVIVAAFVIGLFKETTTEQGYLADIATGFGLVKAALFLIILLIAGLAVCLGKLLFVRKPKAAVLESYGDQDPLSMSGRNYRNLTDEKLFPALMKKTPAERLDGSFARAYREKVLELGKKYLKDYRSKYCFKPEEYESYVNACRYAGRNECWPDVNEWLNEMLSKPEEVDSFPEITTDLGKANIYCSFMTPNAVGMSKQAAEKRAVEDAMDQWNEERDARERLFNAGLSGDLRTDEEKYLGGSLSESTYTEGKFQRDVAEAEARRKIEREIYNDDYDLNDVTEFNDQIPLTMNYFRSLGWYIDMVEKDWDRVGKRSTGVGIPRFYQMLWPVYVVGHKKKTKDFENFKGARRNFFYAIGCLILFLILKVVSDVIKTWDGIWVIINIGAVFVALIVALATLFLLFIAIWYLKDAVTDRKESNIKAVEKQAKSCAPALYRQLRFYKLWKKDDPAVCALERILNRYYEVTK